MEFGRRPRIALVSVALVAAGALLAGCVGAPKSSRPAPTVTVTVTASPAPPAQDAAPPVSENAGPGNLTDADTCGGVSVLEGLASRAQYDETSGAIDAETYQSEMSVVGDGWANLLASPALFSAVKAVAQLAKASPKTFDPNADTESALIEVVVLYCNEIGDNIHAMARPGQGG